MNQKRILKLNEQKSREDASCVVYVMSRDQRVQDNYAMQSAQQSAQESELPLVVLFNVLEKTGVRAKEHFEFMVHGLKQVETGLKKLNVGFALTIGDPAKNIRSFAADHSAKEIFFDFNPLNGPREMQKNIAQELSIPVSVVDAHNIIPLWVLSDKEEFAAHTIRSKVHKNLEEWLVEPPKITQHSIPPPELPSIDWKAVQKVVDAQKSNGINLDFESGESAARTALDDFIQNRLADYAEKRNIPIEDGQSNLSPYLHFGQLSAQRIAHEVMNASDEPPLLFKRGKLASYEGDPTLQDSIDAYLEELIVRRELADNYCFYNKNYTSLEGAKDWGRETLENHRNDPREFTYTRDEWEKAETHDEPWNAAQKEMMKTGKMHGYMRMYWAKKILEWSASPEEALETTIYLNDHYSIDGGDPNGYVGIMWSIAGIHDRPWFERDVFGKIRYMNRGGLERRFDVEAYIEKWTKA